MSTRAQLVVEGNEGVKIYKHSDGYPSGVLPLLQEFLPKFKAGRGWDPEYLTAHLSAALIMESQAYRESYNAECVKAGREPLYKDPQFNFLGHGLDCAWHGDIEYAYRITKDFGVEVYTGGWMEGEGGWVAGAKPKKTYTFDKLVAAKSFKDF